MTPPLTEQERAEADIKLIRSVLGSEGCDELSSKASDLADFALMRLAQRITDLTRGGDLDYSPEYQDEYQRLWHEAAARAEAAEAQLAACREALTAIFLDPLGSHGAKALARETLGVPFIVGATPEEMLRRALSDGGSERECPYCDGRGWNTIAVHDPTDPDGEPLPEQEQCATCGGSGRVSDGGIET